MAASMKVTIVCPPALTVTVAVPVARLLLTSNAALVHYAVRHQLVG